ncbi:MAG: YdcF family protein, partial [Pseudothermotoga sp.]
ATILLLFSLFAYVVTTSMGTFLFVRPLEKSFRAEDLQRCDAVIVLGGGVLRGLDGYELRPHAFKRLIQGVELAKAYNAFLIVSGGTLPGSSQKPEAMIMAELAERFGIPKERILIDELSKNTYENAKNVSSIVRRLNLKDLVLVTSAVHMKRAKMCFSEFHVAVHPYPVDYLCDYGPLGWVDFVPTKESLEANMLGLHEIVGLLWYWLKMR